MEKDVEKYLRNRVEKAGGRAYKFVSPGNNGVPDRVVVLPGGRVYFVELKDVRGRLSPMQGLQLQFLAQVGCEVRIIDTRAGVDMFMEEFFNA